MAATVAPQPDRSSLSVEQLADVETTSFSKQSEPQANSSVFVITTDDIHRSGHRSGAPRLPELLRLASILEVARIDADSYTISARGFNSPASTNKRLAPIDGRSVHEPIGGAVMWRQMDVRLDDTDRIEVISGPGGPRWGANAVNGVITIVRKSWANTQGIEVDAPSSAPVRYIPRTVLVHLRLSL